MALEHSYCSDPQMTPRQCWLFLAVSGHFFLVKSAEIFVGRFCLPWPTYISGWHHLRPLTPPMGPIFPYVKTFCSKQHRKGEKGEGAHTNKTQSDSETAPAAMHTHPPTYTHTSYTGRRQEAEGRRKKEGALGTVNSQFFKKFIFCNTLLTVFGIES